MYVKLVGVADTLTLTQPQWDMVLEMARQRGWRPQGTQSGMPPLPGRPPWDGSYSTAAGQYVTPRDAWMIAEALAQVIAEEEMLGGRGFSPESSPILSTTTPLGVPTNPEEFFRRDGLPVLRDFVDLCRSGGFYIN